MKKYKQEILYLIFGGLTTVINIASYYLLYDILSLNNVPSTVTAWCISVLFAFVTNRYFVFETKKTNLKNILCEMLAFFVSRIITGAIDVAVMWVAVDIMNWHSLLWKTLSNVLVVILNYFASKFLIFKKG